jgi:hypothetical protein
VTPLREGGSLPGLVEADDDGLYVVKLRGAGQGPKALAAELLCGELARALGLPVPELVLLELDPQIGAGEPDPEVQDLLRASAGLNVGVDFLPGALPWLRGAEPAFAADVVWFDAWVENVDRTPRNPNLLCWHGAPWLIDHGAALYRQHRGLGDPALPFALLDQHVLLPSAGPIDEAAARLAGPAAAAVDRCAAVVPGDWLAPGSADFLRARAAARFWEAA